MWGEALIFAFQVPAEVTGLVSGGWLGSILKYRNGAHPGGLWFHIVQ